LLTPKKFEKYVRVYAKKKKEEIETADMLHWVLGKYMAYSFNEPKKYPKKPLLKDNVSEQKMSDEEMERIAMLNCMKMGGEIQYGV
jgi:hypothetical protein